MTSLPSDRTYVRPPLHVSQCEVRRSNPGTRVSFGGNLHDQLLFGKTNVNFEESYVYLVEYVDKHRKKIKRAREKENENAGDE